MLTFLAVFVLKHCQTRNAKALHLKLDAIVLAFEDVDRGIAEMERQDRDRFNQLVQGIEESREWH